MDSAIVLLNNDFTFIKTINIHRAINLLQKKKVEVIEFSKKVIRSAGGLVIAIPRILKLVYYVKNFYKKKVKFNRRNMLLRDNYECVYCGSQGDKVNKLTIDHVIPKSKGGENNFKNTVTCCTNCNTKKKNRTPEEAGMILRRKPYDPTFYDLFKDKIHQVLEKFIV